MFRWVHFHPTLAEDTCMGSVNTGIPLRCRAATDSTMLGSPHCKFQIKCTLKYILGFPYPIACRNAIFGATMYRILATPKQRLATKVRKLF